jgi:hypothetical protein
MSIKEAQFASHSSHNMEYLAIMAAIFLPLTLFTVKSFTECVLNSLGSIRYEYKRANIERTLLVAFHCYCLARNSCCIHTHLCGEAILDAGKKEGLEDLA